MKYGLLVLAGVCSCLGCWASAYVLVLGAVSVNCIDVIFRDAK